MNHIIEEMYYNFRLRITLDKDYSRELKTACCDYYFLQDSDICCSCGKRSLAICPECEGAGDIVDRFRINSTSIDIPYRKCPECRGTGKIEKEI